MDPRLEEASHAGDLAALHRLLQEDRLLLHKLSAATPSVANNPLHIAALVGHADFVQEVLRLNPGLVHDTNVEGFTALHLASARGHLSVVMELINIPEGPDLCRIRDRDGLMPVHTAAVKGRVRVLHALLEKSPELTEELLSSGETILHCAVKSGCCEAVQILVEKMTGDQVSMLLNSKDDRGNTVLHLAAARRQFETIKMLLMKPEMKVNELNVRDLTVLDVLLELPDQNGVLTLVREIMAKGGKTSSEVHPQGTVPSILALTERRPQTIFQSSLRVMLGGMRWLGLTPAPQLRNSKEKPSESSGTLMVVATLIATITFQPIMNPPGGFDSRTGHATRGKTLRHFLMFDIIGLFSSLSIILLLMCVGHRMQRKLMKVLVWILWIAAYSTALAFTSAATTVFPSTPVVTVLIYGWYAIFAITVIWVYLRVSIKLFLNVGWWEMNPLYGQTNLKGLAMRRVLVLIVVLAIPFLASIPGPDYLIDMYFACGVFYHSNFEDFNYYLLHLWAVVMEFPTLYIWLRFAHYLMGIGGCYGAECPIPRVGFHLLNMKIVWIMTLFVAVTSIVGFHFYYITVKMVDPNNFNYKIFFVACY